MSFHVYDGNRTVYETLNEARVAAQAAIDEYRKLATLYEWPEMVSEIAVYEAPDDCGEPWRDGTLVLEARERIVEDEDHPLGKFAEFDLVEITAYKLRDFDFDRIVSVDGKDPEAGLAELRRLMANVQPNDTFELLVADLLPDDDDDGGEEPGAMYRRALKKAEASVVRRRQVVEWALKAVVGGVRGFGIERGANGLWHVLMQDGSHAFSLVEGDLPDQPGAARKVVSALYSVWLDGVRGERARSAPDTITLSHDRLTSALREAAAQGMDHTSGPWSGYAASCREVADRIVKSIETGRFSSDNYHYLDSDRRAS